MTKIDRPTTNRFLATGARYVLAGVFLVSAIGKILSPSTFKAFLESVSWLSIMNPTVLLFVVASLELLVAFFLMRPATKVMGAVGSFGLLLLFSGLLTYTSQTSPDKSCGCFGDILPDISADLSILRNIVLLFLSVFVIERADTGLKGETRNG